MMDISSHVTIEGWKYDLDTMTRTKDKLSEKINKETAVPDKFKKTGIKCSFIHASSISKCIFWCSSFAIKRS